MKIQDSELIAQFLTGESDAVATLDTWIERAARPYRRRLAERWDDILQDVRLEVMRLLRAGRFRGESSLKTYLWRVVSHTCLDQIRSSSRWKWAPLETPEGSPVAALMAGSGHQRSESKDLLLRVLEQTSPACQQLWALIFAGLSYREMSEQLGVKEGALRVRVLRCRKRAVEIREQVLQIHSGGTDAARENGNDLGERTPNQGEEK